MAHPNIDPTDETNPFAPKTPIEVTKGERVARYLVWIGFIVASAVGIWLAKA